MKFYRKIVEFFEIENNKKLIYYVGLFMVILIASAVMIKARVEDEIIPYATFSENKDEEQFIRNLTSGMTIEQKFTSPQNFEVVTLSCSNHEQVLPGRMLFEVYDKNGILITSKEIQNKDIVYDVPIEIPLAGEKRQMYTVKITAMDTEEEAVGFFGYLPEKSKSTAIVNGERTEYVLSIGTHNYTNLFSKLLWTVMTVMFMGLVILFLSLWKKELAPEKAFLLLAIPMGVALLCFLSVNFINDGDAHFARAYHYANVVLGVAEKDEIDSIAMRKDDVDTLYSSGFQDAQHAQNMYHIYENWKWFVRDDNIVYNIEWRNAGTTSVLAYLPSVIAIILARLLRLGTYPMIYLARIFPFIFYLVCCYYAIKITPVGKHVLVFLAALPMAMQQATGITYDNVTYIACFLMISYTLKIYFQCIKKKDAIILMLACALLGCCKGGVYTPMLFILLFLPKDKMGGLKKKIAYVLIAGTLTMCVTVIGYGSIIQHYMRPWEQVVGEAPKIEEVNTSDIINDKAKSVEVLEEKYGLTYAFESPSNFARICISTIIDRTDYYLRGLSGRMAAWAVEELPNWSCALFVFIILLAKNGVNEENYIIDFKLRFGLISTLLIILLVFFVLFLIETPKYNPYIWGIQGRYFLPQIMLLLLAMRNNKVVQTKNSEKALYIAYYGQMIFFIIGYFLIFMTQSYN